MGNRFPIPKAQPRIFSKLDLLDQVVRIDQDRDMSKRVCDIDTAFAKWSQAGYEALPSKFNRLSNFSTNPFVLLMHARNAKYETISQIEHDILPAKLFSSLETSAGKGIEGVCLPIYGWEVVPSTMHSVESALDGIRIDKDTLYAATLKSGPRCLNDEMSENFADNLVANSHLWAQNYHVSRVNFSYGVLYGTEKMSNKKDWHILRKICEKLPSGQIVVRPDSKWECKFVVDGIEVSATIRIGADWWTHLAGQDGLVELAIAIVRACVPATRSDNSQHQYLISDLGDIVSTDPVPPDFNPSILQRHQIPWFFFFIRHFCDELIP